MFFDHPRHPLKSKSFVISTGQSNSPLFFSTLPLTQKIFPGYNELIFEKQNRNRNELSALYVLLFRGEVLIMKKKPLVFAAIMMLCLLWVIVSVAESSASQDLRIRMGFSPVSVCPGDSVSVVITIVNSSGKDFTDPMTLYDPKGTRIEDFGNPVLKNEEVAVWSGTWTVSEEDLAKGKLIYTVKYSVTDEAGSVLRKAIHFSRKLTALPSPSAPEPTPEPTPEPSPVPLPEDFGDVVLYGVFRPNPSTGWVAVGCVDRSGNVWLTEKADVPWPALDQDIREMLRTRRGMKLYENLAGQEMDGTLMNDAWFFTDIPAMVDAVPKPDQKPRKTGVDVGQEAVYGLRKDQDGNEESVLLGMAGSYVYENPSPDAQRLYLFMWRLMSLVEIFSADEIGFAAENVSPQGFRGITVKEFFGLSDGDWSRASVSAVWLDADGGPEEKNLTPEETESLLALAERGMVIRKENTWSMPEDVLTCTFKDEQGKDLGRIRLFSYTVGTDEDGGSIVATLAVAEDGMYQTALMPRPVDGLTEEEIRMMTVRIEGVDYIVGKSTPRDLIHNGWNCFPEWAGAFTYQDPEWNNMIEVNTAGGSLDEPIIHISCQFAYEIDVSYCGFDGILSENNPDDPDWGWLSEEQPEPEAYDPETDPGPEDFDWQKQWYALTEWIDDVIGADQDTSEPGTPVWYKLSDGRFLYLYSANSPVAIALSEYGPDE